LVQAALPWEARPLPYVPNGPLFNEAAGGNPVYGANLVPTPNGPYTSASWAGTNVVETTGQTDPFGGTTASRIADNSTSAQHYFKTNASVTLVSGQKYVMSAYLKPLTYTGVFAVTCGAGGGAQANFDLTALTGSDGGGTELCSNFSVVAAGNGYYLCSCTFVSSGTGAAMYLGFDSLGSYSGSGETVDVCDVSVAPFY
jgi:hypothetical protein